MHRLALLFFLLCVFISVRAEERAAVIANKLGVDISADQIALQIGLGAWGPKWKHMSFQGEQNNEFGASVSTVRAPIKGTKATMQARVRIEKSDEHTLRFEYAINADQDAQLTMAMIAIDPGKRWAGTLQVVYEGAETKDFAWPIGRTGLGDQVKQLKFQAANQNATITFNKPVSIPSDGQLRVVVADYLEAEKDVLLSMDVSYSMPIDFYASVEDAPDIAGKELWFPWTPKYKYLKNNAIVMDAWSRAEAGAKGRVTSAGERLIYDGKPIKFWGVNNCFANCAPDQATADRRADLYARLGINSVRLHKYADGSGWAGILKKGSITEFDKKGLERMDYFIAALKKRGIFVKLSASFGSPSIGGKDWDRIPYAKEWGPKPKGNKRLRTGAGAIYISKELQDLQIEQMKALLNHKNPYTGLTYAEDPAIALIELVNEESALFFGTIKQLKQMKTPRKAIAKQFTAWLLKRYGSKEAILERWGGDGMIGTFKAEGFGNETFEELVPAGNPWFWDPDILADSQKSRAPRLYDAALFLKELQDQYYDRYSKEIRAIGYDGELMASNWQAGRGTSHFYNLHSDARIGLIDRHNYFGGASSMITVAGGGSLSSGMQQVAGRPFSLSEWIHVYPNQWGVEGPAIIAAYGMGLQDWDISYMFQNGDKGTYTSPLGSNNKWDIMAPQVAAVFPAVARHIRRFDVKPADLQIPLNVHLDSLHSGKVGFDDKTEQAYDIKLFNNDKVPARSLAVGKVSINYTDEFKETPVFDVDAHKKNGALQSSTGELQWFEGQTHDSGYFTMNTAATKAVVGFAGGREQALGDVTITSHSPYAAIYLSAQSKNGTIASDKRLVLVAIARAHNTGMKYFQGKLLSKGKAPVLMEPVQADIKITRAGTPTVYVCDHDGNRTAETIPVSNGTFTIDGTKTQTVYYEVVYE